MIIEVKDNTDQIHYLNTAYVVYIRKRPNHGLWKIVLSNQDYILTESSEAIQQIINSLKSFRKKINVPSSN